MPGVTIQTPQQTDTAALAEAAFVNVPSFLPESSYVCVGDTIDTDQQEGFLRCQERLGRLHASIQTACLSVGSVMQGPWYSSCGRQPNGYCVWCHPAS